MSKIVILMQALNVDGWKEKGITPVIAIVLLVMMTVGAAVGTWTFIQNVQTQVQDRTKSELGTGLETRGNINCQGTTINATVENTGTKDIEADSTNIFVYTTGGDVHTTLSDQDLTGQGWTSAGSVGQFSVTSLPQSFSPNTYYTIEVRFVRQDYTWDMGQCLAK